MRLRSLTDDSARRETLTPPPLPILFFPDARSEHLAHGVQGLLNSGPCGGTTDCFRGGTRTKLLPSRECQARHEPEIATAAFPRPFHLKLAISTQCAANMSSMHETAPERSLAAEFAISVLWFLGAIPIALAFWFLA
jgi:hypothetical protein